MIIPAYIASRTLRADNPEWHEPIRQESSIYSFTPIPSSFDQVRDVDGFGRSVRVEGGEEPTYWIDTLDGETFVTEGRTVLKTSRQKCMDARVAIFHARVKSPDIRFRPAPTSPAPRPVPMTRPSGPAAQAAFC